MPSRLAKSTIVGLLLASSASAMMPLEAHTCTKFSTVNGVTVPACDVATPAVSNTEATTQSSSTDPTRPVTTVLRIITETAKPKPILTTSYVTVTGGHEQEQPTSLTGTKLTKLTRSLAQNSAHTASLHSTSHPTTTSLAVPSPYPSNSHSSSSHSTSHPTTTSLAAPTPFPDSSPSSSDRSKSHPTTTSLAAPSPYPSSSHSSTLYSPSRTTLVTKTSNIYNGPIANLSTPHSQFGGKPSQIPVKVFANSTSPANSAHRSSTVFIKTTLVTTTIRKVSKSIGMSHMLPVAAVITTDQVTEFPETLTVTSVFPAVQSQHIGSFGASCTSTTTLWPPGHGGATLSYSTLAPPTPFAGSDSLAPPTTFDTSSTLAAPTPYGTQHVKRWILEGVCIDWHGPENAVMPPPRAFTMGEHPRKDKPNPTVQGDHFSSQATPTTSPFPGSGGVPTDPEGSHTYDEPYFAEPANVSATKSLPIFNYDSDAMYTGVAA